MVTQKSLTKPGATTLLIHGLQFQVGTVLSRRELKLLINWLNNKYQLALHLLKMPIASKDINWRMNMGWVMLLSIVLTL